jgi:hypothetical protein
LVKGLAKAGSVRSVGRVKRVNIDGTSLVTGSVVAERLTEYAEKVARMHTSSSVEIPVLESNGAVTNHTLLLTASSTLETVEIDGPADDEGDRFPTPEFTAIGGKAVPITTAEIPIVSLPFGD